MDARRDWIYFLLRVFLGVLGREDFGTETICESAVLNRSNGV